MKKYILPSFIILGFLVSVASFASADASCGGSKPGSKPCVVISSLSPSSGAVGTTVTITGKGFTKTGNKIKFGGLNSELNPAYSLNSRDGRTLVFSIPTGNYSSCQNDNPPCLPPPNYFTPPGNYDVSVINADGTSNTLNFTVIGS